MVSKESKITNILRRASTHIGFIAAIITGIITVGGAAIGVGNWAVESVNARADTRIAALQKELDESNRQQEISILRLELIFMIKHNPQNVVEIEMLAKKYFTEYGANFYMTELYSNYAREYGADTSFVAYHN